MKDKRLSVRDFCLALVAMLALILLAPGVGALLRIYQKKFGFDKLMVVFGQSAVLFVAAGIGLIALSAIEFHKPEGRRWKVSVVATALTVLMAAFLAIYLGAFVSNSIWGDTLNFQIVRVFITQLDAVTATLPVSHSQLTLLLSVLAGTVVVSLTIVFLLFAFLTDHLVYTLKVVTHYRRAVRIFLAAGAILSGGICFSLAWFIPTSLLGDPVSTFFKLPYLTNIPQVDGTRLAAAVVDRASAEDYRREQTFERKNVILLFSNSLRADHMGVYGYRRQTTPFLSRLYDQGKLHRVKTALSTCSNSFCGIASTLGSRSFHNVSFNNFKLHSLLRNQGYRVNFYLSGDHREWKYLFEYYGNDFDEIHDAPTFKGNESSNDQNLVNSLQEIRPYDGQPNFFYFFLMSSHIHGKRLPEFQRFQPIDVDLALFWNQLAGTRDVDGKAKALYEVSEDDHERMANRYDNGVLQADAFMERIFGILGEKGYLKNSIVVILSDHGDGLGEHGHVGHTRFLYQEDTHIPLLIYDEHPDLYRNDRFATQIDVAPTILTRLGLAVPNSWEGKSLLQPPQDRRTLHQTRRAKTALCVALVNSSASSLTKFIRCGQDGDTTEQFFDLVADPEERQNLIAKVERSALYHYREEVGLRWNVVCTDMLCL